MDEVSIAVLEQCLQPNRLIGLGERFPMATVYRRVKKLVARGFLAKDGELYQTTDRGREEIRSPTSRSSLEQILPQLAQMPTAIHRALAELVAAAIVVRQHSSQDDHHAAFVVVGPTLKWKTWTAKMVCAMFGLDPVDHVLLASSESGRSLLTRRGYGGSTVSKRAILSSPFVAVDEYHKADDRARRMAGVYLQGTRVVAYENERLEIRPVPLFLMNPLKGDTLEARTGLDDPQIRRCIVADFDGVTIPEALRSRGEELIAHAREADPVKLAERRPVDCSAFRDALGETIRRCVTTQAIQHVDEELVLQLVDGMSAFVPPEEAWIVVVRDLFVLWDTLGWMTPGWRLRMPKAVPDAAAPVLPVKPNDLEPPSLCEETRRVLAEARESIPRDLGMVKRVASAHAMLKAARDTTKREQQALERLYVEAKATRELLRQFVSVRDYLSGADLSWEAPALLWAAQVVAADPRNADAVTDLARQLVARRIRGGKADLLLQNLPPGMTWEKAVTWLADVMKRYGNVEAAIAAIEQQEAKAREIAGKAQTLKDLYKQEAANARQELEKINSEVQVAFDEFCNLANDLQKLKTERANLEKACVDLSAEHSRIKAAGEKTNADLSAERERIQVSIEKARDELSTTAAILASQSHLTALYRTLEAAVRGDQDSARSVLVELGVNGGDSPGLALKALMDDALGNSFVPRENLEAVQKERDDREADLREKLATAEVRAVTAEGSIEREQDTRSRAEAKVGELEERIKDIGREAEVHAVDHRATSDKLADVERALAAERTTREAAETRVYALEAAASAAAEEKKKEDAELAQYRVRDEAVGRVLSLAPDGRPIPLADLDARAQRAYRNAIDRGAKAQADRTIAKAMTSKGLVVVHTVVLSKRCHQGHTFTRSLSPQEIETLRTGEMSGRVLPFRQTPGKGYVACPTCGARVTVTLSEVLELLGVQPGA